MYAYELPPPTSVGPGSEVSGDEERLSITSTKSGTQRDAAQTFTTIQRTVRPGNIISKFLWYICKSMHKKINKKYM